MMSGFEIIEDFSRLEFLSNEWDQLAQNNPFCGIFSTFGFARAWWRAFGKNKNLKAVVCRNESGDVRLIAPFYSNPNSASNWIQLGNPRADYHYLLCHPDDSGILAEFFRFLKRYKPWQSINLERLPADAPVFRQLPSSYQSADPITLKIAAWFHLSNPILTFAFSDQHPYVSHQDLEKHRDLLQDYNYQRHVKKLSAEGEFEYGCFSQPDKILSMLEEFFNVYTSQFKRSGRKNLFMFPENRLFYRYLTEEMETYGALRFDRLAYKGKLMAAHFGFNWKNKSYYYKPCFDPAYSKYRPGKLLLAFILKRALEEGCVECDLLNGLEPYKMRYASGIHKTGSINIIRSRSAFLAEKIRRVFHPTLA